MVTSKIFRNNNFDLVRLFAALQVAFVHVFHIMEVTPGDITGPILKFLYLFPGVPIFFFISGFLISKSYENNHCIKEYFQNRILRLFPALIVCVIFSIILVISSGYLADKNVTWLELFLLFIAKITFLQFYNPDYLRAYGDGVLNGSLWTITVEIQFYILTPLIYLVLNKYRNISVNYLLFSLILTFLLFNRLYYYLPNLISEIVITKLTKVSFLPWLYMFLLGIYIQKNFDFFYKYLSGKFYIIFPVYIITAYIFSTQGASLGNNVNPVIGILLVLTIFSLAYSMPNLGKKLLKGNDISYGLYIYHMPVVNWLIFHNYYRETGYSLLALCISIMLALISWRFIERPALRFKNHPLNPLANRKRKE